MLNQLVYVVTTVFNTVKVYLLFSSHWDTSNHLIAIKDFPINVIQIEMNPSMTDSPRYDMNRNYIKADKS
jgi:hypothetical protein